MGLKSDLIAARDRYASGEFGGVYLAIASVGIGNRRRAVAEAMRAAGSEAYFNATTNEGRRAASMAWWDRAIAAAPDEPEAAE